MKRSVYFSFILALFLCANLFAQNIQQFPKAYAVELYNGPLADPDFDTNPEALMFRTRIKITCATEGVNFAGHYTLVSFGCGTACQANFVIDRKTGEIFEGFTTELGVAFDSRSSMLIKNIGAQEMSQEEQESCDWCKITYWEWKDNAFVEIKKE